MTVMLPEMSRADSERAGRAKKNEQFPLSCPQVAPPRRGGAIGRSIIVATLQGKNLVYCAFQLISCQQCLGTRPGGLWETQAVTTHRPNSSSWVGGRVLIVKIMVGEEGAKHPGACGAWALPVGQAR